jgi:hypothetical protein
MSTKYTFNLVNSCINRRVFRIRYVIEPYIFGSKVDFYNELQDGMPNPTRMNVLLRQYLEVKYE